MVTVLFADLVGFTSRAERMDVEDVRAMLGPYYALVREELELRGGTIEKFIGDAVMAVFGAPTAHEDDPERAVRAALAIREAASPPPTSDPRARPPRSHRRATRARRSSRSTPTRRPARASSSGDVVNTAARLQTAAPDRRRARRALSPIGRRAAYRVRGVAAGRAKGKSEPVPCWPALRALSRVGETRRRHDATPLIGRRDDRRAVLDAFEQRHAATAGAGADARGRARDRQEPARPRAVPPPRPAAGADPLAGRPITAVRRRRHVLGAGGDRARPKRGSRLARGRGRDRPSSRSRRRAAGRRHSEAEWLERHLRTLVGLDGRRRRCSATAGPRRSPPGGGSSSVWPSTDRPCWCSRICTGPTTRCSTSSSTSSRGRPDVPLLVLCTARPELLERRPRWGTSRRHRASSRSRRSTRRRPMTSLTRCSGQRACPTRPARRCSRRPRETRCTPRSSSACSSTVASLVRAAEANGSLDEPAALPVPGLRARDHRRPARCGPREDKT